MWIVCNIFKMECKPLRNLEELFSWEPKLEFIREPKIQTSRQIWVYAAIFKLVLNHWILKCCCCIDYSVLMYRDDI